MNYEEDLKIIESFIGRKSARTLACNTLKIRFGDKTPYIWIDPPWRFEKDDSKITASIDYPEDQESFRAWSKVLNPLDEATFENYEYSIKEGLSLYFSKGYSVHAPTTLDVIDEDDFYNHWYASE
jgi:hypothetical protein